jgi:hypothetical protein
MMNKSMFFLVWICFSGFVYATGVLESESGGIVLKPLDGVVELQTDAEDYLQFETAGNMPVVRARSGGSASSLKFRG